MGLKHPTVVLVLLFIIYAAVRTLVTVFSDASKRRAHVAPTESKQYDDEWEARKEGCE